MVASLYKLIIPQEADLSKLRVHYTGFEDIEGIADIEPYLSP